MNSNRRRLDGLRALDAAVGDLSRRLSDHRRHAAEIAAERQRAEGSKWSPHEDARKAIARRLTELNVAAAEAQAEIDRLTIELARLQERRGAASQLACRCRDFLRERQALPRELDF
jgi:hypothetical protein